MKTFSEYKKSSNNISVNESAAPQYTLFPKDKDELKKMINEEIKEQGYGANLNHIDVSKITDFSELFWRSEFNGDISKWDVSKVTDMSTMFEGAESFNQDISGWNVSRVENATDMFFNCPCPEEHQPKFNFK